MPNILIDPLVHLIILIINSAIIPIVNRMNAIPPIDTYFLEVHSNIILWSMYRPS